MKTFLLYGFLESDVEKLKTRLENVLQVRFELRDSSYKGLYYLSKSPTGDEYELLSNWNSIENAWTESKFQDYPNLLYISYRTEGELAADPIFENAKLLKKTSV